MAKSNLKVGLLSVVNAKLGLNDVKLYLGTTLLYPIRDSISSATVTCNSTTYTGSTQVALNIVVKLGTKTLTSGTDYTVTLNNGGINAGTYTVVVTGINDYEGTASGSFVINKANISPSVSIDNWTYGGTAKNPSVSGNTGGGAVTYTYSSDGSTWSSTKPSNAGTYTIKASIAATTNYNSGTATNTFTISKASCPVAITGKSLTYNRASQTLVGITNPQSQTIHYKVGSGSWSTTAPTSTNCGSWTIYWYADANTNYNGAYSSSNPASVSSSMTKVTPVLSTSPTKTADWTYDGQSHALASGGAMKHSSSDSTAVAGTFTYGSATNVGTYTATWSFTPTDTTNYNSTSGNVGSVTVSKATMSVTEVNYNAAYDGSSHSSTVKVNSAGWDGKTIVYGSSTSYGNTATSSGVTGTAYAVKTATNYTASTTVYYKVTGGTNFNDYADSVTFQISKKSTNAPVLTAGGTTTYTGTTYYATAKNGSNNPAGTIYYGSSSGATTYSLTASSTAANMTSMGRANVGTTTIYAFFRPTDTTNYSDSAGATTTVTITNKATGYLTATKTNRTYNGSAQTIGTIATNSGDYYFGLGSSTTSAPSSWGSKNTALSATAAGTYYIWAKCDASTNYNAVSAKYIDTATISQRTVTITAPTKTDRNYTGNAQTIFATGSCTTGGTMYYSDTNKTFSTSTWSTTLPYTQKTDAGTYTMYYYCYVSDTANNTGTGINTIKSVSATINKVAATLPGTISGDRVDTDHTPARATVSKDYAGGTLQYSTNNGSSWSNVSWYSGNLTSNPSTSTVGDTSVIFRVNPDSNHTVVTSDPITLTVIKATDATVTISLSSTLTYTGSAQTIATASNAHGIASYYIGYKKGSQATADSQVTWGSANTTPLQATDAGDYYVYYKFTADSSHSGDKAYTYVGKVTINKKSRSGAVSCNNVTYGSTVTASVSGNTESGTVTWGITAGTGTATINSNGVVTPTKVGKVTVTASVAATANYAAYTATSKEITISQRTVTWSAPTRTDRTYNGSDQTIFAVGSCTAGGTMKYSSDNSTWSTSLPYTLKKESGTYTIYYKCEVSDTTNNTGTNINTSYSLSATISKISTNAPVLTAGTKATYDGNYVYATAKNGSGNPAGTIYYGSSSGSTSYSITASSTATNLSSMGRKDVGTTTIYAFFRPTDTSHYYDSSSANTTASVTNKATGSSGSVSNPSAQTYKSSGTYSYQLGISGATGTVTYPTSITVKNSGGTTISGWSCTSAGVVTVPAATTAGSYTVTGNITVAASTNYNAVSATSKTWTVTINKADQSAPTATDSTVKYHNTATGSASGGGGQGTLYYKADANGGTSYGSATTTAPSRSSVGTTKYIAYWGGNSNYNASPNSAAKSLVVNKATDQSITVTLTERNYTGSAQTIASATSHGCTYYLGTGTSSAVSSWASASTSITATNAGTYYIWYKGTADGNHSADISSTYKGSVKINPIDPTITAPTAKSGLIYNGSAQTLYNAGSNTTAGSFSYSNGTRTEVGTQTVNWTFMPTDTTNYKTKSGSFIGTISTNFKPSGSDALITSDSKYFCSKP